MHIALRMDGGIASFPGLRKPVTVDSERLPPERAQRLHALVDQAQFFTAAPTSAPPGAADLRTYTVEIDDGTQRRTLTLAEPIADERLRALLAEIRDCARAST